MNDRRIALVGVVALLAAFLLAMSFRVGAMEEQGSLVAGLLRPTPSPYVCVLVATTGELSMYMPDANAAQCATALGQATDSAGSAVFYTGWQIPADSIACTIADVTYGRIVVYGTGPIAQNLCARYTTTP